MIYARWESSSFVTLRQEDVYHEKETGLRICYLICPPLRSNGKRQDMVEINSNECSRKIYQWKQIGNFESGNNDRDFCNAKLLLK